MQERDISSVSETTLPSGVKILDNVCNILTLTSQQIKDARRPPLKMVISPYLGQKEALLSRIGCGMFRVCLQLGKVVEYLERSLLSLVTSASHLPTSVLFCSLRCTQLNIVLFSSAYQIRSDIVFASEVLKTTSSLADMNIRFTRRQCLLWYTLPHGRNCWWQTSPVIVIVILVDYRDFCLTSAFDVPSTGGSRRHIAITFATKKLNSVVLDGEKSFKGSFTRKPGTRRTPRQTPHVRRHRPRLCKASLGRNDPIFPGYHRRNDRV